MIVLNEMSSVEEEEEEVQIIGKSDEEEYQIGIESDDDDDSSPLVMHKIQTRATVGMTPMKANTKAPTSQGGNNSKKADFPDISGRSL